MVGVRWERYMFTLCKTCFIYINLVWTSQSCISVSGNPLLPLWYFLFRAKPICSMCMCSFVSVNVFLLCGLSSWPECFWILIEPISIQQAGKLYYPDITHLFKTKAAKLGHFFTEKCIAMLESETLTDFNKWNRWNISQHLATNLLPKL